MMKIKYLFIILMIAYSCNQKTDENKEFLSDSIDLRLYKLPNIGDSLSLKLSKQSNEKVLINSAEMNQCISSIIKGVNYTIAFNDKGLATYISTNDIHFRTTVGLTVKSTLKNIKSKQSINIQKDLGWAYYIPLNSGWNAAFCVSPSCTGRNLNDNDTISWFFRRN